MGVYINMEMPKEGSWVTYRVFPDGQCVLHSWCGNDDEIKFDFMEHLTAVPVPPHGRLIDADAMLMRINHEVMEAYMDGVCYGVHPSQEYLYLLGEIIDDAPTVIPATEEGET